MGSELQNSKTVRLRISNMDCASEEAEIRKAVEKIEGLDSLRFQLGTRTLEITATVTAADQAVEAIRGAGFAPVVLPAGPDKVENGRSSKGLSRELVQLLAALLLASL